MTVGAYVAAASIIRRRRTSYGGSARKGRSLSPYRSERSVGGGAQSEARDRTKSRRVLPYAFSLSSKNPHRQKTCARSPGVCVLRVNACLYMYSFICTHMHTIDMCVICI